MKIYQNDIFGCQTEVITRHRSPYITFKTINHYRESTNKAKRCLTCKHHCTNEFSKIYHKCRLLGLSASEATDIRAWHICDKWEQVETACVTLEKYNQNKIIVEYLKTHDGLTQLEASRFMRPILRLSERIREIEKSGRVIERTREQYTSKDGFKSTFVRYRIKN